MLRGVKRGDADDTGELLGQAAWAALSSPTRLRILTLCEQAPQNSRTLVAEVGVVRGVVNKHLWALEAAGLIEPASREPVKGGSLVSYRAVSPGWLALVEQINAQAKASPGR